MKTTRYFREQVLRKRPYLTQEFCERVVRKPLKTEVQDDGRTRNWGVIAELGSRVLRVVVLEDGETLHNAFLDRDYQFSGRIVGVMNHEASLLSRNRFAVY